MRITGRQLRQIIKEEVENMMNEADPVPAAPGSYAEKLQKWCDKQIPLFHSAVTNSGAYKFKLGSGALSLQVAQTLLGQRNKELLASIKAGVTPNNAGSYTEDVINGAKLILGVDAAPGAAPVVDADGSTMSIGGKPLYREIEAWKTASNVGQFLAKK